MSSSVTLEIDHDGIALISCPGNGMAGLGTDTVFALRKAFEPVFDDPAIAGAVIAAGADGFVGGLDLAWLDRVAGDDDGNELRDMVDVFVELLHRIETSGRPIAAALPGSALGPDLDLAIACHHRCAADGPDGRYGFTDIRFGLPPIGGGTIRSKRIMGIDKARSLLLSGAELTARQAHDSGLLTRLTAQPKVVESARRWVIGEAARRAQKPAHHAIVGLLAGRPDKGELRSTAGQFVEVAKTPVSRAMVRTLGLGVAKADGLSRRSPAVPRRDVVKVGVIGAGLMGGGIALVAARAGLDVVLLDIDDKTVAAGMERVRAFEKRRVSSNGADSSTIAETLQRIKPTADYGALTGAGIVIEAVFEDRAVKAEATRRAEAAMDVDTIFATNTSTLPIHSLAKASCRPERFVGLHFFSPVPSMPLLEIIRGRLTSDQTLAGAMDFAQQIGKTPIIVNDSRGFYTTRVVMAYQAEAYDMLTEGVLPELIEEAGRAAGMPVPPLVLSDAVGLDLVHQINVQARRDLGDAHALSPGQILVGQLVEDYGRMGRKTAKGFYDYAETGRRGDFWPRLANVAADGRCRDAPITDLKDRLLAAQAVETARCFEEGVITDPSEADVGAVLGWGFAPWTGGPLSYIDMLGVSKFVTRCDALVDHYGGTRLRAPDLLRRLAAENRAIHTAR